MALMTIRSWLGVNKKIQAGHHVGKGVEGRGVTSYQLRVRVYHDRLQGFERNLASYSTVKRIDLFIFVASSHLNCRSITSWPSRQDVQLLYLYPARSGGYPGTLVAHSQIDDCRGKWLSRSGQSYSGTGLYDAARLIVLVLLVAFPVNKH